MATSFTSRLGQLVLFVILTFVTLGVYPLYFMITRWEEQNELLRKIEQNTRRS